VRRWRAAALVSGAAAMLGAGVWAVEREVVRRVRRRPDPDAGVDFQLVDHERITVPTHDGGDLAVYTRGRGPAVVLSHGWTLAARVWAKQFADLPERGYRVIAYDQRGHGASSAGTDGYTDAALGADIRSVLEGLDLRDAVLVGHSMGGLAVESFAASFPEVAEQRVRGLVLLSTLARSMLGDPVRAIAEQVVERAPDLGWMMARPDLGFLVARAGFGREPLPSHVEFTRRLTSECALTARRDAGRMLIGVDLTESLSGVTMPVLIVVGSADLLTPPRGARLLHELLPGSRLEVLDGGGHMLMLERSKELEDLIVEFAGDVGAAANGAA